VIFFARYEASQYGSPYIETEHILLGLLREDRALMKRFLGEADTEPPIRAEIERHITIGERISTSVEMPLTDECEKILRAAAEEADRLGHRHVGTEHLLLGMLSVEGSLAQQILQARELRLATLREQLPKIEVAADVEATAITGHSVRPSSRPAMLKLEDFLAGLKWHRAEDLLPFFAENARLINVHGRQWNREEIEKEFVALFAPYAKKNATHLIEETVVDRGDVVVAIVLWKNAILASMERVWAHRMSVVLVRQGEQWAIALIQVTPVQPA